MNGMENELIHISFMIYTGR